MEIKNESHNWSFQTFPRKIISLISAALVVFSLNLLKYSRGNALKALLSQNLKSKLAIISTYPNSMYQIQVCHFLWNKSPCIDARIGKPVQIKWESTKISSPLLNWPILEVSDSSLDFFSAAPGAEVQHNQHKSDSIQMWISCCKSHCLFASLFIETIAPDFTYVMQNTAGKYYNHCIRH